MSTLTLRPSADSDLNIYALTNYPPGNFGGNNHEFNYAFINEATSDDASTYLYAELETMQFFTSNDGSIPAGATDIALTVYGRVRGPVGRPPWVQLVIKSGSTVGYGTSHDSFVGWLDINDAWSTDPATGVAWTVASANALKVGAYLGAPYEDYYYCILSQLYWEWTYTAGSTPSGTPSGGTGGGVAYQPLSNY
jgi:hypothetical protein